MTRIIDNIKIAVCLAMIAVAMSAVGVGFFALFEHFTGYTENLFRMAGY